MIDFVKSLIVPLTVSAVVSFGGTWRVNSKQLDENKAHIQQIVENIEKIEKSHNRRLENLEKSRDVMPDYYVTRREFNVVVSSLEDKMNKVDKNIEKLLDMQMKR